MSSQNPKPPKERLKELEIEFKFVGAYGRRRPSEVIKEAMELCADCQIPYPEWINPWHLNRDPFLEHSNGLEKAFKAGNFGALSDMVYWAREYNEPLPKWAADATIRTIKGLALNEKPLLNAWKKWFRQYKQNMDDLELFELIKEARGEYHQNANEVADKKWVEWKDVYEVAGALAANQHPEDTEINEETVRSAYKRAKKGLEKNPGQFRILRTFLLKLPGHIYNPKLWEYIDSIIKAGNPKKRRNQ